MARETIGTPPPTRRRAFLGGCLGAAGAVTLAAGAPRAEAAVTPTGVPGAGTHVVTLGTAAGPAVRSARQGIATALVVDGDVYLFDCGLGVVRQTVETGLPMDRLKAVFLTHLHSDHIAELPGLLLYQWGPQVGGFAAPFEVVGPAGAGALPAGYEPVVSPPTPGTRDLVRGLLRAFAYDVNIRVNDEARPPLDDLVRPREIAPPAGSGAGPRGELAPPTEPVEVYADGRVRVLAAPVNHPPVFPSYGFRVETPHATVALSGDTTEHGNTVALARDADLLVHEAVYLDYYRDRGLPQEFVDHLARSHTEPAGAGRVASAAGARHLVLSHLAGVATDEQWTRRVRAEYGGTVTVARDGQVLAP